MSIGAREIETYAVSAAAGFSEIAESLLGASATPADNVDVAISGSLMTAFVPVLSDDETIYVGISSSFEGAVRATRSFLGFEGDDPDPSDEDVADAVGELANMTAGTVLSELEGRSDLGLPVTLKHNARLALGAHSVRAFSVDGTRIEITVAPGPLRLDSAAQEAIAA